MLDNYWKLTKLGEAALCRNGAGIRQEFFTKLGTPLVRVSDFKANSINIQSCIYVDHEHAKHWKEHRLAEGDILVATVGSWPPNWSSVVGKVVRVPSKVAGAIQNQNTACILAKKDIADQRFLYFLLKSKEFVHYAANAAYGSASQARLSVKNLEKFTFHLPPLSEQCAIAHILGTLDEKIELNRQMNETLEAMAGAIFKSWFVDFDPVRAKIEGREPHGMDAEITALFSNSFEDSELGEIPKGWSINNLPDVIAINPLRSLHKGQSAPYLEMSNMSTSSARVLNWDYREFSSGMKFVNGDVLLARITPCLENGKTAYVDFLIDEQVGWGSTEYIVFHSKSPLPDEYTYFLARSEELRSHAIRNMTGTSGRQRVPTECFKTYQLVVPPEKIALRFGEIVKPFMATLKQHDEESYTLKAIRDTLLPKLLAGEIRVKDAEKYMEYVV